ncbi:MAG TPA: phage major capsid protein [Phycisphaerae bacterium]|nr:phage major capsid protein [Phycisphaerae bacterium]
METVMEKLKNSAGALAEEFAKGDDRDDAKIAKLLDDHAKLLGSDEAKGYAENGDALAKLTEQVKTLQAAHEKTVVELKRVSEMGLEHRSRGLQVMGRKARKDMLAANCGFPDNEMAAEFGAWIAYRVASSPKIDFSLNDLPQATLKLAKKVADKVADDQIAQRKSLIAALQKVNPDIDPGVSGSGAELVANLYMRDLIDNAETYGVLFPECDRVPLGTLLGTITWPKLTSNFTAYPTAIAATIEQSGIGSDTVTMQAVKWGVLSGIPNEMFLDPSLLVDLGQLLARKIPQAFAYAWDYALANGDDSATYGGITGFMQSANFGAYGPTDDHDALGEIDSGDMNDLVGTLTLSRAHNNAKFYGHRSVLWSLISMRDSTGQYVYRQPNDANAMVLNGYPAVMAQVMTAAASLVASSKFCAFGDLRMAMFWGMARAIQIGQSEHAAWNSDITMVRGIAHVDAAEADSDALITGALHS